jgi:hypothetical protein
MLPARSLPQVVVDRLEVDAYQLPLGESRAHFAAGDERIGSDDRLRRGEVVAVQDVRGPDSLFGFDELPAEQNEVLGDEEVDERLVVDVDLAELRALEERYEDVHMLDSRLRA